MFLPALAALLPTLIPIAAKVLPAVLPMLGSLLGGGGGPAPPAVPPAAPAAGGTAGLNPQTLAELVSKLGADPNAVQLLTQLLSQMASAGPPRVARPAPPALRTVLRQVAGPAAATAARRLPAAKALALHLEALHQWSAAVNPPAPAAAAQSVRRPAPRAARHISKAFLAAAGRLPYRRVAAVRLAAEPTPSPLLGGRPQVIVAADRPAVFRFRLDTPKPIPAGELTLEGKHAVTLALLFRTRTAVAAAAGGPLDPPATVTPGDLAAVPAGEEFLLTATLAWRGKGGKAFGTSVVLPVRKSAAYLFDRIGAGGTAVPLSDPQAHRNFWHKVWEAGLDTTVRRYALDVTYTYTAAGGRPDNARPPTVWSARPRPRTRVMEGTVTAGLETAPAALARLLPLAGAGEPWPADRLPALASSDLADALHRQARRRVAFAGRPGDTVALWVYPEVQPHDLALARPGEVTADGFVAGLEPVPAMLPLPVAAHFVGVGTPS